MSCSRDAACRVRLLLVCFCSHAFLFSRRLRKERRVFCIHAGAGGVASFATTEGAEVGEGGAKRFFRESIEYTFVSFEGSNPHCDARTGRGGSPYILYNKVYPPSPVRLLSILHSFFFIFLKNLSQPFASLRKSLTFALAKREHLLRVIMEDVFLR